MYNQFRTVFLWLNWWSYNAAATVNTVKPVLRHYCHERPPVLNDHTFRAEAPTRHFNIHMTKPVTIGHLSWETTIMTILWPMGWSFKTGWPRKSVCPTCSQRSNHWTKRQLYWVIPCWHDQGHTIGFALDEGIVRYQENVFCHLTTANTTNVFLFSRKFILIRNTRNVKYQRVCGLSNARLKIYPSSRSDLSLLPSPMLKWSLH